MINPYFENNHHLRTKNILIIYKTLLLSSFIFFYLNKTEDKEFNYFKRQFYHYTFKKPSIKLILSFLHLNKYSPDSIVRIIEYQCLIHNGILKTFTWCEKYLFGFKVLRTYNWKLTVFKIKSIDNKFLRYLTKPLRIRLWIWYCHLFMERH